MMKYITFKEEKEKTVEAENVPGVSGKSANIVQ
jgi:hypothetical protein